MLDLLREEELRAVLAHERAHVEQRHDLVVLPFAAFGTTFPWLPAVRSAQAQVALLVEMLADDRAARSHPPEVLARLALSIERTVADGDFQASAAQQNLPLRFLGPDAYRAELVALKAQYEKLWAAHPWKE